MVTFDSGTNHDHDPTRSHCSHRAGAAGRTGVLLKAFRLFSFASRSVATCFPLLVSAEGIEAYDSLDNHRPANHMLSITSARSIRRNWWRPTRNQRKTNKRLEKNSNAAGSSDSMGAVGAGKGSVFSFRTQHDQRASRILRPGSVFCCVCD